MGSSPVETTAVSAHHASNITWLEQGLMVQQAVKFIVARNILGPQTIRLTAVRLSPPAMRRVA